MKLTLDTEIANLKNGYSHHNMANLQKKHDNYCVGRKDPTEMTDKEYLKAFAKGPCSPTILLPGLIASKLIITIDCKVLKATNPAIFTECGWEACGGIHIPVGHLSTNIQYQRIYIYQYRFK